MHIEDERIRLRGELAGLRFLTALARLELKYREDQAREPATGRGGRGGRFVNEHGGGGSRLPSFVAPLAGVASATEAGVAAAAEGVAAAGMATAGVLGGAMLGLTSDSRAIGPTPPDMGGGRTKAGDAPISLKAREACEADYDDEVTQCYDAFGLRRQTFNPGHSALRQCVESANDRFVDCLRRGGSSRSSLPLRLPNRKRGG